VAEHHHHDYEAPVIQPDLGPLRAKALLVGLGALAVWAVLGFINMGSYKSGEPGGIRDFFLTYQVGFVYWLSLPVGSMALLLLSTMTSASWGLVFRRLFQAATRTLPFMMLSSCRSPRASCSPRRPVRRSTANPPSGGPRRWTTSNSWPATSPPSTKSSTASTST
jgi:hypothetical protein